MRGLPSLGVAGKASQKTWARGESPKMQRSLPCCEKDPSGMGLESDLRDPGLSLRAEGSHSLGGGGAHG